MLVALLLSSVLLEWKIAEWIYHEISLNYDEKCCENLKQQKQKKIHSHNPIINYK